MSRYGLTNDKIEYVCQYIADEQIVWIGEQPPERKYKILSDLYKRFTRYAERQTELKRLIITREEVEANYKNPRYWEIRVAYERTDPEWCKKHLWEWDFHYEFDKPKNDGTTRK